MKENTKILIEEAHRVLASHHPMTLRQVFYRLVAGQVIENRQNRYKSLSRTLVRARQEGMIPWEWIEDRLRIPREVGMWGNLAAFGRAVIKGYRRDVWPDQADYIEVWLEKDALSGIFERALRPYGVTLNVGRGYDSWSSICSASQRYETERAEGGADTTILYFGDFDPSGEDMVRSLEERLGFFGCWPTIEKIAITAEDIERYDLPPNPAKLTDSRADNFIALHGNNCVELDALPPDVLSEMIEQEVDGLMDMDALAETREQEKKDVGELRTFFEERVR